MRRVNSSREPRELDSVSPVNSSSLRTKNAFEKIMLWSGGEKGGTSEKYFHEDRFTGESFIKIVVRRFGVFRCQ